VPVAFEALLSLSSAQVEEGRDIVDANDSTSTQLAADPRADVTAPAPGPDIYVADSAQSSGDPEGPTIMPAAEPTLGNSASQD
jgi:hypothetical protein